MTNPTLARQKASRNRTYTHPVTKQEYPSVTTVKKMLHTNDALMNWAVKMTAEYVIDRWDMLAEMNKTTKRRYIKGGRYEMSVAPGTTIAPSTVGTLVHGMIEQYIKTGVPSFDEDCLSDLARNDIDPEDAFEQCLPRFGAFKAWNDRFQPQWELCEATVFNHTVGYAGTLDGLATIGGKTYLIDFKAANGIYPDYSLQLHALAHGEEVVTPEGVITPMKMPDELSLLWITPPSGKNLPKVKWQQVHHDPEAFEAFKSLVQLEKFWVERSHLQFGVENTTEQPVG